MQFDINSFLFLGGTGLIIALVQIAKKWVNDSRWYPVISIAIGLIINLVIAVSRKMSLVDASFMGLIAGLVASGIYSFTGTGNSANGGGSPPKPPSPPP